MEGNPYLLRMNLRAPKSVTIKVFLDLGKCRISGISVEGDFFAENPEPFDELMRYNAPLSQRVTEELSTYISSKIREAKPVGLNINEVIDALRKELEEALLTCAKK